jgi:hypothetical protein
MPYWTSLCVLRRTCRQSGLYETPFHCNTLSKHHHYYYMNVDFFYLCLIGWSMYRFCVTFVVIILNLIIFRKYQFWNKEVSIAKSDAIDVQNISQRVLDKYRKEHTAEQTETDSSIIGHLIKSPYPTDKERVADVTVFMIAGHETTANQVLNFRRVLLTIKLLHKYVYFLCSLLMPYWTSLCVLRRTCRQSSLYETLFHCNIQNKNHHQASWLIIELSRHPLVVAKIRAELDALFPAGTVVDFTPQTLSQLHYLTMVIKEGMRLWACMYIYMYIPIYAYMCIDIYK